MILQLNVCVLCFHINPSPFQGCRLNSSVFVEVSIFLTPTKEQRKNRSIYFLRKALKFPCGDLRPKSLQLFGGRGTLPPMGRKELFGCALTLQCCSPWIQDWREGRLLGSCQLPRKSHILLPPGVTGIYEAARLRHISSISITSMLAPCWHVLGTYLCCWEQSPAQALTLASLVRSSF